MMSRAQVVHRRIFMTIFIVTGFTLVENTDQGEIRESCTLQTTCATCISAATQCTWCYDDFYSKPRCDHWERHVAQRCNKSRILNPLHKVNFLQDESLSDSNKILIKPQKVRLQIRPHETAIIPVKFYTTKDHAVDMYFLMDLSYTMRKHIEELSRVSMELVENIRNLTGSLHVGIGSFVDKLILPYGFCETDNCEYTFMQKVKLTNNFKIFKQTVSKLQNMTISNYDDPEGGLDALMQSVVCGDKIGWRKNSRKLIIYCSDAPFHFAGDGQLGGAVVPNDGKCHMKNNVYTKEHTQDYPSVDHIAQVIQKHKVTVIFAVAGHHYQVLYHLLSQSLTSSYVSELGSKNNTIANIVTMGYKNITSTVEMKADNHNFKVDFHTNCTNGQWIQSKKCSGIKLGEMVDFRADITAPECPKGNQSQIHKMSIYPVSSNAQLEIEVELICKCNCNKTEFNSSTCNKNGTLVCGECICNEGFSGKQCECNKANKDIVDDCVLGNSTEECMGRGTCECGRCFCHNMASNRKQFYRGTYCECDDYSCPNYNGALCGGPSHGSCECGVCKCSSEYEGEGCQCSTNQTTCLSKNKKICNGHGQCKCGVCKCDESSGFIGDTCDDCPTCNNWCEINKECVKCWLSKDGGNMLECSRPCKIQYVSMADKLMTDNSLYDVLTVCKVEVGKCIIRYQTIIQNETELLLILKKKECPKSETTVLVIGIVSGIFLLGLLILIIWKIVTSIVDQREMARFKKESSNAVWTTQMNPLFIKPSTTYENPTWLLNG